MTNVATKENALFSTAFYQLPIRMVLVSSNGKLLKANHAFTRMLGYSEQEIQFIPFTNLIHAGEIDQYTESLENHVRNKRPQYEVEIQLIHMNGTMIRCLLKVFVIYNHDSGVPDLFSIQVKDSSNQIQTEETLIQGDSQYKILIEDSPDGIAIFRNGKILYVNNTLVKMAGALTKKDLIGKFTLDFIPEKYHNTVIENSQRIDKGIPVGLFKIEMIRLDQKVIEIELKGHHTTFEDRYARYYIIRDVTHRRQMEQLLMHSEKLSMAGQLAAGIAHEVRNPLTTIKGFLQLLNSREKSLPYSKVIFSEINRIELILKELLLLSKPQKAKMDLIDFKGLLQNVILLLNTEAIMHDVHIKLTYTSDIEKINADPNQLKQVFINFIKNAIEAMSDGGVIRVAVLQDKENLLIHIIDQGIGIPKEHLDKIGSPFFTTKENGTGLGMMISKQIIARHNGTMNIKSNSSGTTIQVHLPTT